MIREALVAWILALPVLHDGHGFALPRPRGFENIIATVVLEHSEDIDPRLLAAALDVVAAHESAYRKTARGDGGRSKGAWQTPAAETPDDPIGQARVAAKWLIASMTRCPDYPIALYATGHVCGRVHVADLYWKEIRAELAIPLEVTP